VYHERLGRNCNSSPIASDGRIYLSDNDGKTFVIRAGPKFELLATNDLAERITASPAVSGNQLVYRTDSHLYCIAVPPVPSPAESLPSKNRRRGHRRHFRSAGGVENLSKRC
jgi:hypothetical protein